MKRIFISYAEQDSEAALYLATQLRGRGVDLFIDYERMMSGEQFSRRLANEIRSRDCVVLVQSRDALVSSLVQSELAHALQNNVEIISLVLEPLDLRASGEYAFLLNNQTIDFTGWAAQKHGQGTVNALEELLRRDDNRKQVIASNTAQDIGELATLVGHESWIRTISFSPDGSLLASVSNDKTMRLWDLRPLQAQEAGVNIRNVATLDAHNASVWDVTFSPVDALVATCGNDNTVRLWELEELPELYELARFVDHHEPVYSLSFSHDGQLLASASHDNSVHLRDIQRIKNTGIADAIVPLLHSSHVYSVRFSPNAELVASASRDSTVRVWRIDRSNLRSMARSRPTFLTGHMSWVNTVDFSPYGGLLASTSHDRTIRLWDTSTMQEVGRLVGHRESVNSATFSPDGRLVASTSKDNTVRLWDVASQTELASLTGHTRWVNDAVFSPDGRFLATASGDNTIKVWGVGVAARN